MNNIKHRISIAFVLLLALIFVSCNVVNIEDRPDPNNTALQTVVENPSPSEINTLVTGTESSLRTDLRIYHINVGMIGREMYRFLAAEPRNTQDLLGGGSSELDAGSFYTTRPWAAFYTSIRNANILIESVKTITDNNAVSEAQRNGIFGFAKTIKAYQYLMALTMHNENGIRQQNQTDFFTTGPLLSKADSYQLIADLLDEAATHLSNAGSEFSFPLSDGFADFNSPSTFLEFNQALRARVAVYRGNFDDALGFVNNSFVDASGDLENGVYHIFSTATNDVTNPLFSNPQSGAGDSYVVHPSFVADAESGDNRVVGNKAILRVDDNGDVNTASLDGLSSDYGLFVYKTQTSPMPIIRNAELLLIRAEANINGSSPDLAAAEDDINIIRNAAGLSDYGGAQTQQALEDEMLRQRRYELFFEGHRWVDMRRYNRLGNLPLDRSGDNVWASFPIPESENL
ncbi:RagB/SusD family nutrient uptake outer membrane protein [Fodinibius saliphilus]|uniref:RagB/SusD family nutrient uptake outer membrane protein n=1 Tax=Fodinibius saliphilus TaxID=1920650 RepID=UPI001107F98C|nr:RagB/SusD family nutrient uptake outer membrane protein [Fodinibius saliphilus]